MQVTGSRHNLIWCALYTASARTLLSSAMVVFIFCQPAVVVGQPALSACNANLESLSLYEAYCLARNSDPNLAIARYKVDGALADKDEARGGVLPQISIFGDWSENEVRYDRSDLGQLPSQEYPGERYGVNLRTPLLNMRLFREYQRQNRLVGQSEQQLAVAESMLLSEVVGAYLLKLLAEETVEQVEAEFSALESQVEEVAALYEKSLVPVTQVLETQTRADGLRAQLVDAQGKAAIAFERLTQLLGQRNFKLRPVTGGQIPLLSEISDAEQAAELATQFDPAIAAAEEALKAARTAIDRERGSWWPEVDFIYSSQFSDVGFDNLSSPPRSTETYTISLRYPLFQGGAGTARIRGAWADFYTAKQELEATKRAATGRARAAWVNLETATKRVEAARQAAKTARVNLDASRKAVRSGTAKVTDVLVALAQNTRAQRDLSEARFQRAMSWLELELSAGATPGALAPSFSRALSGD